MACGISLRKCFATRSQAPSENASRAGARYVQLQRSSEHCLCSMAVRPLLAVIWQRSHDAAAAARDGT